MDNDRRFPVAPCNGHVDFNVSTQHEEQHTNFEPLPGAIRLKARCMGGTLDIYNQCGELVYLRLSSPLKSGLCLGCDGALGDDTGAATQPYANRKASS